MVGWWRMRSDGAHRVVRPAFRTLDGAAVGSAGMTTTTFEGRSGIRLAADVHGEPDDPPVVLLHGGGQTRHAWGTTAEVLADHGWYAVNVDLRGHGDSAWAP